MAELKTLHDGAKDLSPHQGAVDIIAVHGLGANPDYAWLRKRDVGEDQHEDVNWLSQLLPDKVPSARIRCFNYDSRWIGNDLPKQRLTIIAEQLLAAFQHSVVDSDRPVIFIGHSFGGIVIEQALVLANANGSNCQQLIKVAAGVIFLGTPHQGSNSQSWGDMIAKSASLLGFSSERGLLKNLDIGSDTLRDLVHQFTMIVGRQSIPVLCFFELYETSFGHRVPGAGRALAWLGSGQSMIVDEASATIPGLERLGLQTDHFKINKFRNPEDPNYICVSACIHGYAQGAWNLVHPRFITHPIVQDNVGITDFKQLECLRALFLTDPIDDKQQMIRAKGRRVNGTCEWISINETYLAWLRNPEVKALWISGGPGKGKSMLSIYITEELTKVVEQSSNAVLAYYFCDNKDVTRSTGTAILRGLILQVLRQRPRLFHHILKDFDVQKEKLFDSSSAQTALWRVFRHMVKDPGIGTFFCIVDALDECEILSLHDFVEELRDLYEDEKRRFSTTCKILVVSRSLPEIIPTALAKFDRISLDPEMDYEVNQDLQLYITIKLAEIAQTQRWQQRLRDTVYSDLTKRSDGTFLWVSFVAQELGRISASEVAQTLKSIPKGLDAIYDRMLVQIPESRRDVASQILLWVVNAVRPLTLAELAVVTGTLGDEILSTEQIMRDRVGFCGDLLRITEASDEVGMVHQSVKDYLRSKEVRRNKHLYLFHIEEEKANTAMTRFCLSYLHDQVSQYSVQKGLDVVDLQLTSYEWGDTLNRLQELSFWGYAAQHWPEHARRSNHIDISHPFLEEDSCARTVWLFWKRHYWDFRLLPPTTPLLHLASFLGVNHIVEEIIKNTPQTERTLLNTCSPCYEYFYFSEFYGIYPYQQLVGMPPLFYAVWGGHEAMIQLWLDRGAIITLEVLFQAVENNESQIVKLLLEHQIAINTLNKISSCPPLIAIIANRSSNEQLVQYPEPDEEDTWEDLWNLLSHAVMKNNLTLVQLLLDNGVKNIAPKKGSDSMCSEPLFKASLYGYTEIVALLLERQAECYNHTAYIEALEIASEKGHSAVVQLLLAHQAAHYSDEECKAALWEALLVGNYAVVRVLLNHEANVLGQEDFKMILQIDAENQLGATARLLVDYGFEVDQEGLEDSVFEAVRSGEVELFKWFLSVGVDPNIRAWDQCLIDLAAEEDHTEIVGILLEHGADPNSEEGDRNFHRFKRRRYKFLRPIEWAFRRENAEMFELLLNYGAKDPRLMTP